MKEIFLLAAFAVLTACNDHPIDTGTSAVTGPPVISNNQVIVTATGSGGVTATFEWTAAEGNGLTYDVYATNTGDSADIDNFSNVHDADSLSSAVSSGGLVLVTSGTDISSATINSNALLDRGTPFFPAVIIVAVSNEIGTSIYYPKGHMFSNGDTLYDFPFNNVTGITNIGSASMTLTASHGYSSASDHYGFANAAVSLDGSLSQSLISVDGLDASLAGTNPKTLAFWAQSASSTQPVAYAEPVAFGIGNSGELFGTYFAGTGGSPSNGVYFWGYGGSYDYLTSFTYDSSWHQWLITYGSSTVRFYEDGVEDTGGAVTRTLNTGTSGANLFIGNGGGEDPFSGALSDVVIFNTSMSSSDVAGYFNVTKVPACWSPDPRVRACRGRVCRTGC